MHDINCMTYGNRASSNKPVWSRIQETQRFLLFGWQTGKHHVKDMEVSLPPSLCNYTWLFQQVVFELSSYNGPRWREDELKVLAKPWAVVVQECLSVPECLQNWIYLRIMHCYYKFGLTTMESMQSEVIFVMTKAQIENVCWPADIVLYVHTTLGSKQVSDKAARWTSKKIVHC